MNKKTKKLILIIVSAVLAVALISTGAFFTVKYIKNNVGNVGGPVISFESKTALAGDTVQIPLSIAQNSGIWGGQIIINYDAAALSFVSCANGEVFDGCEVNDTGGTVVLLVSQSDFEDSKTDGIIATLNFNVKVSADKGNYGITFDAETNFSNSKAELVELTLKNGSITVK